MKRFVLAGLTAAALALAAAAPASAGTCPADQVGANALEGAPTMPNRVTDTVLGEIDLGQQYGVPGRNFRMRRLVIQPGGVVPLHSHGERPAHIYVVRGRITEYNSNCRVPITHIAGDLARESGNYSHWWKNESRSTVTLISADILPPAGNPAESM